MLQKHKIEVQYLGFSSIHHIAAEVLHMINAPYCFSHHIPIKSDFKPHCLNKYECQTNVGWFKCCYARTNLFI